MLPKHQARASSYGLLRVIRSEQLSPYFGRLATLCFARVFRSVLPLRAYVSRSSHQQCCRNFIVAARCLISRCGAPIRYWSAVRFPSSNLHRGAFPFASQGFNRRYHRRDMEFMFMRAHAPMKPVYTRLDYLTAATSLWLVCSQPTSCRLSTWQELNR